MEPSENLHDQYFGHQHITVIRPTKGWRSLDLKELWAYRELLWVLTMRDIKVRYKQTALGVGWAVIQPFMVMVVFSIFFGRLAKMPPPRQASHGDFLRSQVRATTVLFR